MRGVATNVYSRKTLEKKTKERSANLKIRVRELFAHGEGISTPHVCHKGQQPLIECAQCDFKIIYFYLFFWGRQGGCPYSYISLGAMWNLDIHSSLSLNV